MSDILTHGRKYHREQVDSLFLQKIPARDLPHYHGTTAALDAHLEAIRELAPKESYLWTTPMGHWLFSRSEHRLDSDTLSVFVCTPHALRWLSDYLREGDVFVDVGANVGIYSLAAAEVVGSLGRVISFEPDPSNFDLLTRNVKLNGFENVRLVEAAVGDGKEKVAFFQDSNGENSQAWQDQEQQRRSVEVSQTCLDEVIPYRINLIKIDVQGFEVKVLRGARNSIKRQRQLALFLEVWPYGIKGAGDSTGEMVSLLYDEFGFSVYLVGEANNKLMPLPGMLHIPSKTSFINLMEAVEKNDPTGGYADLWCVKSSREKSQVELAYFDQFSKVKMR